MIDSLDLTFKRKGKKAFERELTETEENFMRVRKHTERGVKDSMLLQMSEMKQWGIMADWRQSYSTLAPRYQAMVIRTFGSLIERGLVFRGERPIFWSVQS